MTIHYEVSSQVAIITIARPPANSLDHLTRQALLVALNRAIDDPQAEAIVIWGGPRVFSTGADIQEVAFGLDGPTYASPTLPDVVSLLDTARKPVVAAIAGACLGGGLEIALACHQRICSPDAKFGLPEVKLGVLPGAGGTQRLPRLVGLQPALQLILSGTTIDAQGAQQLGLARTAEGDLLAAARSDARSLVGKGWPRVSELTVRLPDGETVHHYFSAQRATLRKPLPAQRACIDAVEATLTRSFSDGCRYEGELFRHLVQTPESKALCYAFFSDRAAGKPSTAAHGESSRPINRVGIIGAGTMGGGIAICCLDAGLATTLMDVTPAALADGRCRIEAHYAQLIKKGRMNAASAAKRTEQLVTADIYDALSGCDLIIEAVHEDMTVKQAVFRELDRTLRPGAIIASNTSTLDLNEIAQATCRPEDVVGLHFFSPANVMRLLEVVRGDQTSVATLMTALKFGKSIGKTPVVARVCDGFIGNRMFEEYLRQAYILVDMGVSPYRVDAALEDWGMAMGPFAVVDLAGGDIGWAIRRRRRIEQPDRPYSVFPDHVCELKRFGRKTGAGYYTYDVGGRRTEDPSISQLAMEHARAIGRTRTDISDEEIIERCIFALVNEGMKLLHEEIADRASDIDVVCRNGYGFPAHRGGPLFFADLLGLDHVLRSMAEFRAGYAGWFWEPAPQLVDAARQGTHLTVHLTGVIS